MRNFSHSCYNCYVPNVKCDTVTALICAKDSRFSQTPVNLCFRPDVSVSRPCFGFTAHVSVLRHIFRFSGPYYGSPAHISVLRPIFRLSGTYSGSPAHISALWHMFTFFLEAVCLFKRVITRYVAVYGNCDG
ncbi:hypothetical protein SAMN05216238_10770 [Lentibacillus persicus]|uniref:Uncharacterized protein n=1 Tax=Lentibacillus persicus TaxID=640948 RepID=A0A1I1X1X1_9BACI|nr:hypothetical protein SAMN05216238_10770 [Lentibacillus persicus]